MNADGKRWVVKALAVAVFGFLGWQVATLLKHRQTPQPLVVVSQPQAPTPAQPAKTASRKAPKVVRDISRPEPVMLSLATNEVRLRDASRPQSVAISPATLPFEAENLEVRETGKAKPAVRLVSGFEGAPEATFTRFSDTYWVIDMKERTDVGQAHFFLFRVEGAAGRTITFEIRNAPSTWATLNPVYSYVKALDDLSAFTSTADVAAPLHKAASGSRLPDTSGQSWHFIEKTELRKGTFSFTQSFDQDAYVCMRYPYTPAYNQRYLDGLAKNSFAKVVSIGTSKEGRPLQVVKIGEGTENDEQRKPCVLIYAREHPDEPDASWAAQGAIDFLISSAAEARQIRKEFTFLIIPVLDPDGAAKAVFNDEMMESYYSGGETPESAAYAAFFKQWVDKGNPLPLAINLHSTVPYLISDARKPERFEYAQALCGFVNPVLQANGFRQQDNPRRKVIAEFQRRFGYWLATWYGTLEVPLAVNAQDVKQNLTIQELREIGKLVAIGSAKYLGSEASVALIASVDKVRSARAERWAKYGDPTAVASAFAAELQCKRRADADADSAKWATWQAEQLKKFHF